nr:hypothetical protein [Mesorhizobium sp.]
MPAFYGAVGTSQVQIDIPYDMVLAWDTGTRIRKMTLHAKVAASAERVLACPIWIGCKERQGREEQEHIERQMAELQRRLAGTPA